MTGETRPEAGAAPPAHSRARLPQDDRVPFVSYPHEWSFGQLKAAALLTLRLQRRSMAHGMSLKDASAFNVQFLGSRPVFIDTLVVQDRGDPASLPPVVAEPVAPVTSTARVGSRTSISWSWTPTAGRTS